MLRSSLLVFTLLSVQVISAQLPTTPKLIPVPVSMQTAAGSFQLPNAVSINLSDQLPELINIGDQVAGRIRQVTGFNTSVVRNSPNATIQLLINKQQDPNIGKEGYTLQVSDRGIRISANEPAGVFYGIQTLWQLLPAEIESKQAVNGVQWKLPYITIQDQPRFGWRGLMLDVARHFFTVAQVKDFIDNMVKYKFNMLHLHLTDDQGWRIEIKSLPRLTEVGAWRAERTGRFGEFQKQQPGEKSNYGGFYTHEDIRELIAYAKERYVTILPEIDIPGHSLAMIAAYPELVCTPGKYQVSVGDRFMIWPGNGKFYGILDNNLCPANEKVYEALDKIFTEVAQLFPYEYIHMGGDETYKGFWEKSTAIKELMKREKLKDQHEVQSYFVKRVGKIIASKGKKMMGWDEIMEGGLAPGAAVMSWQGEKGGIEATRMKHPVVMSPNTFTYVDLYQGDPLAEPPTYSMVRLNKTYQFNPIPAGADSAYILGGQANLWSERLHTVRHRDYMLWPRGWAVAESVWSPVANKNWDDFIDRTEAHFNRFDKAGTNYSRSMYDPIVTVKKGKDTSIQVILATEVKGLEIHYSFDEFPPDNFYPVYKSPLEFPAGATNLKVVTYRDGKQMGKQITLPLAELKKRAR